MIIRRGGCGQEICELFISQYRRTPLAGCCGREIDAGDLDDGLPRGFLAGAIVKMWVAHRLDWAGELLGRRGEELARDVGSSPDSYRKNYYFSGLIYEMVNCLVGVILK